MIKKLFVFTFILFSFFANNALAHTGLKSSSPENGEVMTQEVQEITLTFDSKIEQNSKFTLNDSNGNPITIDSIELNENTMVGLLLEPLKSGDYQLNWKIIGADGHLIEGEYSFSVELPNSEDPTAENSDVKEETPTQTKEDETAKADEANTKSEQNKSTNPLIPIIIGGLIVIGLGSFFWITRRKK